MIEPLRIDPQALYDDGTLRLTLGLTDAALARARRSGALRYSRCGLRTLYRGQWLLDWLDRTAVTGREVAHE
jgi:hypothetical protein